MAEHSSKASVDPLRSERIAIAPLRLDAVFDDADRVIERIEAPAPHPALSDPLRDPAWQKRIVETYPPAFRA